MRLIFPLLPLLLLCPAPWAHLNGSADGVKPKTIAVMGPGATVQTPLAAGSRQQGSRLLLEFRFRQIRSRMDSLWEDSLSVAPDELPRFRRAMHTAAKVLAEAEGRLVELKHTESEPQNRKWETLRARMERTIFGLDRYLTDTEAYWLPTRIPGAQPVEGSRGGDL